MTRGAGVLAALASLLAGCADSPQLADGLPTAASRSIELDATPFFPQEDYQCGPAALATLLVYSMLSAALAWWVTASYFPEPAPFIRLVVGGSTLGAAYLLLLNIGNFMNGLAVAGKR